MRNVPLMPQRDVFIGSLRVGAHHAGEAADLLSRNRIAFMRHGGGALLLFRKELFGFAHFSTLQVANLDGDLVERCRDDGERGDVVRMAVALDDLRGHGRGLEAKLFADALFVLWAKVPEGSYRSR